MPFFFQYYPLVTRDIHLENGHGGIRHLHANVSKQIVDIWSHMKAVIDRNSPLKGFFGSFKGKSGQETAQQVLN